MVPGFQTELKGKSGAFVSPCFLTIETLYLMGRPLQLEQPAYLPAGMGSTLEPRGKRKPHLLKLLLSGFFFFLFHNNEKVSNIILEVYLFSFLGTCNTKSQMIAAKIVQFFPTHVYCIFTTSQHVLVLGSE